MNRHLEVVVDVKSGVPVVEAPLEDMWELVEFLSWHRVLVSYDYAQTHFTVTFPHLDMGAAERLIMEWNMSSHGPEQHAEPVRGHVEVLPAARHGALVAHRN